MKSSLIYIISITFYILTLISGGCRGNADTSSFPTDTVMPDSVMPDTIEFEEEKEPEKPVLTTTEEILEYINNSPDKERYNAGIIPQMAKDVPEYAGKLLNNEEDGFLIVDKNTMKCYRYDRFGVEQERVGIACAKPYGSKHKYRDNRTPEGYFTIEGIYNSTEWLYTDDDGNTSEVKGQFGPRFMRLKTPVSSQIGIHGTVAPWSIGGRRSHGCIRMLNENILRFAEICKAGWPVIVSPGPRDMKVNEEEGYDIPSVAVIPGRPRCKPGMASMTAEETQDKKSNASSDPESTNDEKDAAKHSEESSDVKNSEKSEIPVESTNGSEAENGEESIDEIFR